MLEFSSAEVTLAPLYDTPMQVMIPSPLDQLPKLVLAYAFDELFHPLVSDCSEKAALAGNPGAELDADTMYRPFPYNSLSTLVSRLVRFTGG